MNMSALVSLTIAMAGGVAFLAYRHKKWYSDHLFPILVFLAALFAVMAWSMYHGEKIAVERFSVIQSQEVRALSDTVRKEADTLAVMAFALGVTCAYLVLLRFLPDPNKKEEER